MTASRQSDPDRCKRYHKVLDALVTLETIALDQIKTLLPFEHPGFVTRIVHELRDQGYLREDRKRHFQWVGPREEFPIQIWVEKKVNGPRLTRTPAADRPRERLLAVGVKELRTAELLAILIRSGRPGESALQAGEKIVAHFADSLERLAEAGGEELRTISSAVILPSYCQIMAGIELGRRIGSLQQERTEQIPDKIRSAADAIGLCRRMFQRLGEEGVQFRKNSGSFVSTRNTKSSTHT